MVGASPALAGNGIPNPISGDFDFLVDAFDIATGSLLWRHKTNGPVTASPGGRGDPFTID